MHRCRVRPCLTAVAAAALVLACPAALSQSRAHLPPAERIVVVADVHGAYAELSALLRATGVVDDALAWSGGETRLVSLGDLLDRGAESRRVMDLLMRLDEDAARSGGGVHVLLGNHEVMNLVGDLRYVAPAEFAAFADDEPDAERAAAFARLRARLDTTEPDPAAFEQLYPRGYFAHRRAFAADGVYGRWLLSLPSLLVIGDTAFVHGGLSRPIVDRLGAADVLNRSVEARLRRYLELRARLADAGVLPVDDPRRDLELAEAARSGAAGVDAGLLDEFLDTAAAPELGLDGPHWYRGAVHCPPLLERPVLDDALERLGAARIVVGHTPTPDRRVRALHDGRLITLDTGMLVGAYSGRPAALVIENGAIEVQYVDPDERVPLETDAVEAYGLTEAELLDALRDGDIEPAAEASADDPLDIVVRYRGAAIEARRFRLARTAARELAAYRLDRLLDMRLVPPTAARGPDADDVLQLRYPDAVTESERVERDVPLGEWCALDPQIAMLHAFDALIGNTARRADTVLIRTEQPLVKAIGHGRTFGTARRVRADAAAALPAPLADALAALDAETLSAELGNWLDERQVRSIIARRDALLNRLPD